LLIEGYQETKGAVFDDDYPEIFIYNCPVKDPIKCIGKSEIRDTLIRGVKKLESIGVDFIAIPCNTVQLFLKEMREAVSIPIIGTVEETIRATKELPAGLLATTPTVKTGLYSELKPIVPNEVDQENVNETILSILAGKLTESKKGFLVNMAKSLKERGANSIILGCTDLSLVPDLTNFPGAVDSLEILSKRTIEFARGDTK
jgi:aspartate racemase